MHSDHPSPPFAPRPCIVGIQGWKHKRCGTTSPSTSKTATIWDTIGFIGRIQNSIPKIDHSCFFWLSVCLLVRNLIQTCDLCRKHNSYGISQGNKWNWKVIIAATRRRSWKARRIQNPLSWFQIKRAKVTKEQTEMSGKCWFNLYILLSAFIHPISKMSKVLRLICSFYWLLRSIREEAAFNISNH